MSKRVRQEGSDDAQQEGRADWPTQTHVCVLNVGGRTFRTTTSLLQQKTSYFRGMFDSAAPEAEVFIDRDPDAFAILLRFLRHGIVARALPRGDPDLCAAVLAEADFLGVETLLQPVKVAAYRNMQVPRSRVGAISQRLNDSSGELDDDGAAHAFDEAVGSITEAIEAGVLPARFFAPVVLTVRSMVPPQSTCWAQIGFVGHEANGFDDDDLDPDVDTFPYQPIGDGTLDQSQNQFDPGEELPMSYWTPECVRRVVYFANIELDGVQQVEPEAVILLTDEDQHAWMRNGALVQGTLPSSNNSGEIDPRPFTSALSHGQRMLLLRDYITSPAFEQLFCPGRDCECDDHDPSTVWTKIIFAEKAPTKPTWKMHPHHPGCAFPMLRPPS
jgi:hypothetical protein